MEPTRDPEGIEIEYLRRTGAFEGRSVLEIGCGNGRLIWRYAGIPAQAGTTQPPVAVAGVDPDETRLADAAGSRSQGVTTPLLLAQAQAEDLPFADEVFQTAIFGWSL